MTWPDAPTGQPRVLHGRERTMGTTAEWVQLFDGSRREVDEWIDAGDWVITMGIWIGTG